MRLIYVQQIKHSYYAEIAQEAHVHRVPIEAQRGWILDRYGKALACNETRYTLFADGYHLVDPQICLNGLSRSMGVPARDLKGIYSGEELKSLYLGHVVKTMAEPLGLSVAELTEELGNQDKSEIVLEKGLSEEEINVLKAHMEEAGVRGIYTRKTVKRFYPRPDRLTHVIGFTDHEGIGREGVEGEMEGVLGGKDGFRYIERDRRGREIAAYRGDVVPPVEGKNVRLTIDSKLQEIVEGVLEERGSDPEGIYAPLLGAEKISVVLMHPYSGEVLAVANRPHFDLETRQGSRRNYAVTDAYEPGSTFKIVTLGGVFDQGLVSVSTPVFCHFGRLLEDGMELKDHHPYGELSVMQVFAKSSNIGTYKLAKQLGREKFHAYMKAFGFGTATGIELNGESRGTVHDISYWSKPSFSRMAMGYEVAVTPLQMLAALGVVANGGEFVEPRVIAAVEGSDGAAEQSFGLRKARRVISRHAAAMVKRAMVAVTANGGTGTAAAIPGYTVAGKTGTAQKYDTEAKRYLQGRYVVSFMGFLPADRPELMGVVVVDDPQVDHVDRYGGTIAAPLFRRIAEQAMASLNVEPEYAPSIGAIGGAGN
ncbi:MAG: penicillin-binding protein 2 [Verrucomicrobiales bacterium]|nr:penicillin-binding protein 2 [Verrucomicrobiales bacterium]